MGTGALYTLFLAGTIPVLEQSASLHLIYYFFRDTMLTLGGSSRPQSDEDALGKLKREREAGSRIVFGSADTGRWIWKTLKWIKR